MTRALVVLCAAVLVIGCQTNEPDTVNIVFSLAGTTNSASTTEACGEHQSQHSSVAVPQSWSCTATLHHGERIFLYLSAQNNKDSGSLTATITVDGRVFQTNTSTGAYVIARASGSYVH
jgi:hypothetical protein